MRSQIYLQAVLPRAGLGNRLFPWARCKLAARKYGIPMLPTLWPQASIGPILRRESDSRIYFGIFSERNNPIGWLEHAEVRLRSKVIPEVYPLQPSTFHQAGGPTVMRFTEMLDYFSPLNEHQEFIRAELLALMLPKWQNYVNSFVADPIVLNVRCGDFKVAQSSQDFITKGAVRTPFDWFIQALSLVRKSMGDATPASIVSNGSEKELAPLLRIPGVRLIKPPNAMVGMFLMSKSRFLIGSGGSSFTAWGSYLGKVPTIVIPGQSLDWFKLSQSVSYHGEWSPDRGSDPRLRSVLESLSATSLRRAI